MTRPQNKTLDRFALMCDFKATVARLDAFDNDSAFLFLNSHFFFVCVILSPDKSVNVLTSNMRNML